tara:strand:+ start:448 stop:768 length:321 start_codon:yes stop_codon:yes gene_type:complete
MATGTALAVAAFIASAAGTVSSIRQGEKQAERSRRALREQKATQAVARSAAASERLAQSSEAKRMRKRKPNTAAIMARARQRRMSGETFLSGNQGTSMTGSTRYLG